MPGVRGAGPMTVEHKPPKFVTPPFTIVADTREQAPWRFTQVRGSGGKVYIPKTVAGTLASGDYSIAGNAEIDTGIERCVAAVAVERKSKADLFASVGRERARFEREFERLQNLDWSAVVVEADELGITTAPPARSQVTPATVMGTVESWSVKYPRTHWFLCPTRRHAEVRCFHLLRRWWNLKNENKV